MTYIYELKDITQSYAGRTVLEISDLKIEKGSIVGITGPNGCGKSTLLRILAFLERPLAGSLLFKGKPIKDIDENLRREATLLLQETKLLKRTVFENVAYGLKARGTRGNLSHKVNMALDMVGLDPTDFAGRLWFQLSGGESQRVALASRLVLKPEVLILDEPTASIDSHSARIIARAIVDARQELGTSIILVSHDIDWAYSASDEVISMFSGKIRSRNIENIIPGPWEQCRDGTVCRHLEDGQVITANRKPGSDPSTGLLDPGDIILSLNDPGETSARNILRGRVTRMTLEDEGQNVLVTVNIQDTILTSRITKGSLSSLGIVPGSMVILVFKANSIRWA